MRSGGDPAAMQAAQKACQELAPGGRATPQMQEQLLAFCQCMRDNGVPDFPDPEGPGRLLDPENDRRAVAAVRAGAAGLPGQAARVGLGRRRGGRRMSWRSSHRGLLAGGGAVSVVAAAAIATAAVGGGGIGGGSGDSVARAAAATGSTATVASGRLSSQVYANGTLGYAAQPDGTPYAIVNQRKGAYTSLPAAAHVARCGKQLYRIDDVPVLLLCGGVPAWRSLYEGMEGPDVRQLNRNLVALGYAIEDELDPQSDHFSSATSYALGELQKDRGLDLDRLARARRRGLPARAAADHEGDRHARHERRARRADRPGDVDAAARRRRPQGGAGVVGRRRRRGGDHAAGQQHDDRRREPRRHRRERRQGGVRRLGLVRRDAPRRDQARQTARGRQARPGAGRRADHDRPRERCAQRAGHRARRARRRPLRGRDGRRRRADGSSCR